MRHDVAVVMPVRNGARFMIPAIDSVLSQSHGDFVFIIVDDGSTDGTWSILEEYAGRDSRIRLLRQDAKGVAAAMNRGIESTDAELIARMDADDIALPQRLERQIAYLDRNPGIAVVGSFVRIVDATGRFKKKKRFPTAPDDVRQELLHKNPICHPSVLMRRQAVASVGGYDERFPLAEDQDLWLRLSSQFDLANIPEELLEYRDHAGQTTDRRKRRDTYVFSCMVVLKHIFALHDLPPLNFSRDSGFDLDQVADLLGRALSGPNSRAQKDALYYQAARLLRMARRSESMRRMAKEVRWHAARDFKFGFFARDLAYRFI